MPPEDLILSNEEITRIAKHNTPINKEIEKSAGKFRANKGAISKNDWDAHF